MPKPTLHDSKPGEPPQPRRRWWRIWLAAVLFVGVVGGALYVHGPQAPSPHKPVSSPVEAEAPADPDDQFRRMVVGGEPEIQVRMILATMGDRVEEPILELTEDRLVLLDQDGETKYEWRRAQK